MILIQRITVEWTKESRGGRGAAVRNSFPEAFTVPPFDESNDVGSDQFLLGVASGTITKRFSTSPLSIHSIQVYS
jgi:hypothetical protein